jgi:nucleoside-diphosphate-sugar epimerase
METQTVLVVGGSGFIGRHVLGHLTALGHDVIATHSPGRSLSPLAGVTWLPCDLRAPQATGAWPDQCATVLFLAQARNYRDFPKCSQDVFAVNVAGLHQTLEYAIRVKARRAVYASSGSVYAPSAVPAHEHEPVQPAAPRNFYAASKLAAEILLGPFAKLMPVITLRLFMPYGPGQNIDMLYPQLMDKVRSGKPIQLHGRDGLRANPVACADVAAAFARCLALEESVTMNLAGPEIYSLRAVGETMGRVLGRQPIFQVQDQEAPCVAGSTALMRRMLNWSPSIGLEEGLRAWVEQEEAYALAG